MSLTSAFKAQAEANPGKNAIAFGTNAWTYSEFHRLSRNVANNLLRAGAEPGDRVALHLLNGPAFAFAAVGCLKAGLVSVPLNTRLKGREIDYILRHSGSAFYIGDPELYNNIADSCPALDEMSELYLTGQVARAAKEFFTLLRTPVCDGSLAPIPAAETAIIAYTSGTTAHPKGVVHTHGTLLEMAKAMSQLHLDEDQVVVVMSSMAHMVGFGMCFTAALANGATTVITRPFEFENAQDAFERWHGTYTVTLPVYLQCLVRRQAESLRDLSSARFLYCGGDSVTPALHDSCARTIGPVRELYGATEMAPACWNHSGEIRVGSIGRPGNGIQIRIADAKHSEVPAGCAGEIYLRGAHLTPGYWQDPETTTATFQDGWFRSGDLAVRDQDGFYWFAGRKKGIIIRGGSNISPQEVEAVLCEHPAVAEAGVVGKKDALWGEIVMGHVALHAGKRVEEEELIAFMRKRIADYKVPATIIFHSELPKGPTGKIQRRALREEEVLAAVS